MKILALFFFLCNLFTYSNLLAQSFQNTYGLSGNQEGISVVAVGDGYVISGNVEINSKGDFYLSKIDENGNQIWQYTYGDANTHEAVWHLTKTNDGGFLMTGTTASNSSAVQKALFIKTDNNGSIQWQKTYTYSDYVAPTYALALANGEYMVTGFFAYDSNTNNRSALIMRLTSTGDIIWCKAYHGAGLTDPSVSQTFTSIAPTQNENFIVTIAYGGGGSGTLNSQYDNAITCVNNSGNVVWAKHFGGAFNDSFNSAAVVSPTEVFVGGSYRNTSSDQEMAFCKVNQNGTISQRKKFGGINIDVVWQVVPTLDRSKIYFVGYTSSIGAGDRDMLVLCTDINGNYLWSKTFGGRETEIGRGVTLTNDGNGVIIIGQTGSFGAGQDDVYVVKIENTTNVQCNQTDFVEVIEDITDPINDFTFNTTSIPLGNGNAMNKGNITLTKNSTCCVGSVSISGITAIPCSATSTTLSAPTGYTSYLWTFPNGTTSTNRIITASLTGLYSLRARNASNCDFFDQTTVTSLVTPSPDLVADSFSLPCEGTISLSAPVGYTSYLWTFPNGTTSTNQTITTNLAGNYLLQVQNASGCVFTDSTNVIIGGNSDPIDLVADSFSLPCEGTISLSAPVGYTSYLWTFPNGTTSTNQTITATLVGNYLLQVRNTDGCLFTDQTNVISDEQVNLADLIIDNISLPCGTTQIISLTEEYSSYLWTFPNGITSTNQTISTTLEGIYIIQVQNSVGCKFIDSLNIEFIKQEKDLLKDDFDIRCNNQSVELSLNQNSEQGFPKGFVSYLWIFPNGQTSTEKTILVNQEGIYKIIVVDEFGCQFEDSTEVKAINPILTQEDVANVITPNKDGFNDTFVFPTENAKLSIYSRWEEKVYQSDNYQHNWNAENLPSGMYFVIAYDVCSDSELRLWIHVMKD